jgi:hypothetical protein
MCRRPEVGRREPTSDNCGFAGSGRWRGLHCNPPARHAPCWGTGRADLSGFGKPMYVMRKTLVDDPDGRKQ